MSLSEAVAHINNQENDNTGLTQIRDALKDGEIPARWGVEGYMDVLTSDGTTQRFLKIPTDENSPLLLKGKIKKDARFWENAVMLPDQDSIVIERFSKGKWDEESDVVESHRKLFLLKERILELWPVNATDCSEMSPASFTIATADQIHQAVSEVYAESTDKPPNSLEAESPTREKLKKKGLRPRNQAELREVIGRPEFKKLRLGQGQRPA